MVARNMAELERMLMSQLTKAMDVVAEKVKADMYEETASFYTQGKPQVYIRTGALGDTPRTTTSSVSGKSISFEAYLDQNHNYETGTWSMPTVLKNAEAGTGGILGKSGFWKRSENKIQKTLDSTLKQFFK